MSTTIETSIYFIARLIEKQRETCIKTQCPISGEIFPSKIIQTIKIYSLEIWYDKIAKWKNSSCNWWFSKPRPRFFRDACTDGASVVVHYNNPNKKSEADDTAAKIRESGAKAIVEQADLTKTSEIKKLFDQTMKEFNQLDILIDTAGADVLKKPFVEITEEEYDHVCYQCKSRIFLHARSEPNEWLITDVV